MEAGQKQDTKVMLGTAFAGLLALLPESRILKSMNLSTNFPRANVEALVSVASPLLVMESTRLPTRRLWNVWVPSGHLLWELVLVAKYIFVLTNFQRKEDIYYLYPSIGLHGLMESFMIPMTAHARALVVSMDTGSYHRIL
jgi:hypothetical protein